jgi:hypothetical protein
VAKPTGNYKEDFDFAKAEVNECFIKALKIGGPDWVVEQLVGAYNAMYGGSLEKTCMGLMVLIGEVWNESEH